MIYFSKQKFNSNLLYLGISGDTRQEIIYKGYSLYNWGATNNKEIEWLSQKYGYVVSDLERLKNYFTILWQNWYEDNKKKLTQEKLDKLVNEDLDKIDDRVIVARTKNIHHFTVSQEKTNPFEELERKYTGSNK